MNNWGALKWALLTLIRSHLSSGGWPVPGASVLCSDVGAKALDIVDNDG